MPRHRGHDEAAGDDPPSYAVPPESPFALMSDHEVRVWFSYMRLHLRLRYEMNRQLRRDSNISLADYDVLVALTSTSDATMTITALATRIGLERSRVSHHVRRMAERDLVRIAPSPADRRVSVVTTTETGAATLRSASREHVALVREMFLDALDTTGMARLAADLDAIYARVLEHGTLPAPEDHP